MRDMFRRRLALVSVAMIAALGVAAIAVPAVSALTDHGSRDFRGKVISTDRHPRIVKVDTRSNGGLSFRVNKRTRFEHIKGFSALKPGLKVEVQAKHRSGGWTATKIDRRGSHSKP